MEKKTIEEWGGIINAERELKYTRAEFEQIKYKNKIKGYLSGGALLFLISIFIFMAAFYISDIARHTVWSFFILGCFFWACATYSILCYIYPESKFVTEW